MQDVVAEVRAQLSSVFGSRSVIHAGGVAVAAAKPVEQLRGLGATRFLLVVSSAGTGVVPEGPDVELLALESEPSTDLGDSFRAEERAIAQPSAGVRAGLERFDPRREAIVLVPPFLDVRSLGDRVGFGARRADWVAIEDKTRIDDLFDAAGVPRPPSAVVAADEVAIANAVSVLDRGAGTVWAGDARQGFNGGGEMVRWVRDDADRREALDLLTSNCDRVRVATFADGVACSIHGFVLADGVAVFRPVELVTLRAPTAPRLSFAGCATFFDPPREVVETMRAAARRVGEHLRTTVDFRGAFTLDGIAATDGWVATECNPRFGAGLRYLDALLPDACISVLHHAVIEGVVDVAAAALECAVVDAASRTRWGMVSLPLQRVITETLSMPLVGGAEGFRRATDGEPADVVLWLGPGRSGGHVRLELEPGRVLAGPSIGSLAVAGFAFADEEFDLGIGPLAAAPEIG